MTLAGVALLVFGLGSAGAAWLEYRAVEARRAGLELKLESVVRRSQHDPLVDQRGIRLVEDAGHTGGTALVLTGNNQKARTSMGSSLVGVSGDAQ